MSKNEPANTNRQALGIGEQLRHKNLFKTATGASAAATRPASEQVIATAISQTTALALTAPKRRTADRGRGCLSLADDYERAKATARERPGFHCGDVS
jgi:hypothetical protein